MIATGTAQMTLMNRFVRLFLTVWLLLVSCSFSLAAKDHLLTVKVGVYENPPKVYTNARGEVAGIFPDILEVIAGEEGWRLEYVHGTWDELLTRLADGEIDIMVDIAFSKKRAAAMSFSTENVFLNWGTIYTREGLVVESLPELKGKTIATVTGDIHTVGENGIIRLGEKFDLGLQFVFVDSYADVLELVDAGRVDAGVVNRLFGIVSEDLYSVNKSSVVFNSVRLKYAFSHKSARQDFPRIVDEHIHRLKQDPNSVFHEIINSYLAGIEYDLEGYYEFKSPKFTPAELSWLEEGHTVRIGVDPGYAPYSYLDKKGEYQGLAVDILQLLARHLGLNIEVVDGLSWSEIMGRAKKAELDAVLTAVRTDSRLQFLDFTDIYLPTPLVIITKHDTFNIEGPEDIAGKRVALVSGYSATERIKKEYAGITSVMVDTPLAGLAAVSAGEADCYVGVLGVVDHLVREGGISNLKVAGRYDMLCNGQSVAVRKDWPLFLSILNKGLRSISEKKSIELYNKWIFSLSLLDGPAALQEENALTAAETKWVLNHQNIALGIDPEFAPFEFMDEKGRYRGITAEYVKILNKRLGLQMQLVPDLTWSQVIEKARKREVDVLPIVGKTRERQEYLKYTNPYMSFHRVLITRTDMPFISSVADVEGMKIAVQKDSSHQGYLRENTTIEPTEYLTLVDGLKAVSDGKEDAFVGNLASAMYWIRKVGLTNLKVAGPVSYTQEKLYFSARNDWPELVTILNKGLASISSAKEKQIRERWVSVKYEPGISPKIVVEYLLQAAFVAIFIIVLILAANKRLKKEIIKREKVEKDLTYKLTSEKLLSRIAARCIHLSGEEVDIVLKDTLVDIAELLGSDLACVLEVSEDVANVRVLHAWPQDADAMLEESALQLSSGVVQHIESVSQGAVFLYDDTVQEAIPHDECGGREHPLLQGKVGIVLPLFRGKALFRLFWFTTNDANFWLEDEARLVETVGYIITNSLNKVDIDLELQEHRNMLEQRIAERTDDLEKSNLQLMQEMADKIKAEMEKEKLQGQLFHTQKMESVGTLAGGIAHEFNNILTVILGNTEVTRALCPGESTIRDNLDRILEAGGRAKKLVSQILTFSRDSKAEPEIVELVELVSESLQMLRPTLPPTIEIKEEYTLDSSKIFADASQIHQVLINLCTNASHAMEKKGGVITVTIQERTLDKDDLRQELDAAPGDYLQLSVSDSGTGIPDTIRSNIFDPFFTTKKIGKGTGLGLSIVHGIIKKAGGVVQVESETSKGTTFHLYFPAAREGAEVKLEKLCSLAEKGSERILLVDDDPAIAEVNKNLIETMGYQVTVRLDAEAALELFTAQPDSFDLVITDQTMPHTTGTELAHKLCKIHPALPVILCTGYSSLIEQEKAEAAGVRGFLLKPFSRKEVGEKIRLLLDV